MFTVVKIREDPARNAYRDPGWYKHPKGTVATLAQGETPPASSAAATQPANGKEVIVSVTRDGPMRH